MDGRLLLLGLDGADPEYLPRYLPKEFKVKSIENSVPLSGPAWTSLYTGKTAGEHGVTHIWGLRMGNSKRLSDIEHRPFWEKLPIKVGVFNAPVTYPPRPVNGFILSGFPIALDDKPFCYPEGIIDEDYWKNWVMDIAQYGGFGNKNHSETPLLTADSWDWRASWWQRFQRLGETPAHSLPIPMNARAKEITESMGDKQLGLLKWLLGQYPDTRFLFAQFSHIDRLFHLWGVSQESIKYVYDEAIRLLNGVKVAYRPDKTFIVSDHGFLDGTRHGNRKVAVFAYDREPKLMPKEITDIHDTVLAEFEAGE